ncbi:MAG: hypothetical protein MJ252_05395 [archaeon]|nr:hypothetical protein [archaeon]
MKEHHTENRIKFEIKLKADFVEEYKNNATKLMKDFKLESSISMTNMVLWNEVEKLIKFEKAEDILEAYYPVRLHYYDLRKQFIISSLKRDLCLLDNKTRFILAVVNGEITISKVKKVDIVKKLVEMKFDTYSKIQELLMKTQTQIKMEKEKLADSEKKEKGGKDKDSDEEKDEDKSEDNEIKKKGKGKSKTQSKIGKDGLPASKEFNYLLDMPLWSLTYEKVEELQKQKEDKEKELAEAEATTIETMWLKDMDEFIEVLDEYEAQEEEDRLYAAKVMKDDNGKKRRRRRKKKDKSEDASEDAPKKKRKKKAAVPEDDTKMDEGENKDNKKKKKKKKADEDVDMEDADKPKEDKSDDASADNPFDMPLRERVKKKKKHPSKENTNSKGREDVEFRSLDDFFQKTQHS